MVKALLRKKVLNDVTAAPFSVSFSHQKWCSCDVIKDVSTWKNNHEILATLQYKPLYNISSSEKWGKKIQAETYNGGHIKVLFHKLLSFEIMYNSVLVCSMLFFAFTKLTTGPI